MLYLCVGISKSNMKFLLYDDDELKKWDIYLFFIYLISDYAMKHNFNDFSFILNFNFNCATR